MSTMNKSNDNRDPEGRQRFLDLMDRIASIPDEEIPEFPIATNQYAVAMIQRSLDAEGFCDQARFQFATLGVAKVSAVWTNTFISALLEAGQKSPQPPSATAKDFDPTQELILTHRTIKKMFECM